MQILRKCYKAYPGLGNRSIFYPGSSVGSTVTFGVDGRTRVQIPLRTFFSKNCLRARLITNMSPWVPRFWIEVWVGTYDRIRRPVNRYVPKIPPFQGGENVIRLYPGLGNRSIFYPGSSVGSTITVDGGWRHYFVTYSFFTDGLRPRWRIRSFH